MSTSLQYRTIHLRLGGDDYYLSTSSGTVLLLYTSFLNFKRKKNFVLLFIVFIYCLVKVPATVLMLYTLSVPKQVYISHFEKLNNTNFDQAYIKNTKFYDTNSTSSIYFHSFKIQMLILFSKSLVKFEIVNSSKYETCTYFEMEEVLHF